MIPLPANLTVSVQNTPKNSPTICCCTNVQFQVVETHITEINHAQAGDFPVQLDEPASSSWLAWICQCFNSWIPGHAQRVSEVAAKNFEEYLTSKYGSEITTECLRGENWEEMKKDLRVKHVYSIKSKAEQMQLEQALAERKEDYSIDWVVKRSDWNPTIVVEPSIESHVYGNHLEPFTEEKLRHKLQAHTNASEQQINEVIKKIKEKIFHSNDATVIISNQEVHQIYVEQIAEAQIPLKPFEKLKKN